MKYKEANRQKVTQLQVSHEAGQYSGSYKVVVSDSGGLPRWTEPYDLGGIGGQNVDFRGEEKWKDSQSYWGIL